MPRTFPSSESGKPPLSATDIFSRIQGYSLQPAPEVEAAFKASGSSTVSARALLREDMQVATLVLTPLPPDEVKEPEQATRNWNAGAINGAEEAGQEVSTRDVAGVPVVAIVTGPKAEAWTFYLAGHGVTAFATREAAAELTDQMISILNTP